MKKILIIFKIVIVLFILQINRIDAQMINKKFNGVWINQDLVKKNHEVQNDSSIKSIVIPRVIYINDDDIIRIEYHFEQKVKKFSIRKKIGNNVFLDCGNLQLLNDTIILNENDFGKKVFVKLKK